MEENKEKKRFLLLIDALGSGGAERQIGYLAAELHKAGYPVKLVTFYDSVTFYTDDVKSKGVDVVTRLDGQSKLRRPFVIRSLVKEFKPDMVIAYKDGASITSCMAKFICRFRLTVSERNTSQGLTLRERIKFMLYRKADHIVPNSYSQAEFIKEHFPGLMPKVKVITNMIDTGRFVPDTDRKEKTPLRVITTARIMPQKNLHNFLRALAILKERGVRMIFDWYGNYDKDEPEYHESVFALQKTLGLENMITFHAPEKKIEKIYLEHDVFILPSLYEGFPNVLCEAMACGLPAIATAVCDSVRILTDSRFLANPESPESIADALERMAALSAEERYAVGCANHERITELCSPESFLHDYLELN